MVFFDHMLVILQNVGLARQSASIVPSEHVRASLISIQTLRGFYSASEVLMDIPNEFYLPQCRFGIRDSDAGKDIWNYVQ